MRFIDTHIHLLAPEWQEPLVERMESARQAGIDLLLQPGVRSTDWDQLLAVTGDFDQAYVAPGLHPMRAADWSDSLADRLLSICRSPRVLAIGEIGLDALLDVDLAVQERAFHAQLEIARKLELPVLIHCRKKSAEVLDILEQSGVQGIWHGFSGSVETAHRIIELGFLLGIGPVLLRDNARKLPEVVRQVPGEVLVLETDAPDMATGPEVLLEVAQKLAELRDWTLAECARITSENARRILQIEDNSE